VANLILVRYLYKKVFTLKKVIYLFIILFSINAKAQYSVSNNIVELTGVVMTADSLRFIPFATVNIKGKNQGTYASDMGVFSLIAQKGDTLLFSSIGYRDKKYVIPTTLEDRRYSIIQLMVQDTFYLPETIIRPGPSKERFDYAFKYWQIPDDKFEIARKNTEQNTLRITSLALANDGRENQGTYQRIVAFRNTYANQRPPQNIFSPLAWVDFFNAWKRGDFKRKYK
jgi:CarboxypepD_reg-like domain